MNSQSTYNGNDRPKGYNPGLDKYIPQCSVDRKMVLRAQELAPSGIMLVIFEPKCKYLQAKQSF